MNPTPHTSTPRHHAIDALRVIAFGLLILYHIGMFFVPWDWHVKTTAPQAWLETPMLLINQWRMPLIFVVSGLAVHLLLAKVGPRRFASHRLLRLGVPLLVGMVLIVPPQAYVEALRNDAFRGRYIEFLGQYFGFAPWPDGAFAGSDNGITWNHLWYLPYLLTYCLLTLPLARWLTGNGRQRIDRALSTLSGRSAAENRHSACSDGVLLCALLAILLVPLLLAGYLVFPHSPGIRHDLLGDWYAHAMYGTFFLFGVAIGSHQAIWGALARCRWVTLAAALGAFSAWTLLRNHLPTDMSTLQEAVFYVVLYANRCLWIFAVLGWAQHEFQHPSPRMRRWLAYGTEAVYPWYILHQTLTVVAGWWVLQYALPLGAQAATLLIATIGGCAVLHHYVIRPNRWLRPLFGLPRQSRKRGSRSVPALAR